MRFKTESSLNLFIVISVTLHLAAGFALFWFSPEKRPPQKEEPYIVRIVPVEPPEVLDESPPESLKEVPPPKTFPKKAPPPKEERAAKPEAKPQPKPAEKKASKDKGPEEKSKEAEGAAPPGDEGAAPETPAEEGGEIAGKDKGKTGEDEGKGKGARLFDPDVISGVIAKKDRLLERDGSITFDTHEIRYYSYMRKLKARIESVWEYPRKEAEEGIYGDLVIRFVIRKDGSLGAVELVRTSGWRTLDEAALEALRDGNPYWPLPEEWGTDSLTVTGHFIYSLYGYYYIR